MLGIEGRSQCKVAFSYCPSQARSNLSAASSCLLVDHGSEFATARYCWATGNTTSKIALTGQYCHAVRQLAQENAPPRLVLDAHLHWLGCPQTHPPRPHVGLCLHGRGNTRRWSYWRCGFINSKGTQNTHCRTRPLPSAEMTSCCPSHFRHPCPPACPCPHRSV